MKKHSVDEPFEEDSICRYSFTKKKKNHVRKPRLYLYSWVMKNNYFIMSTRPQQKTQSLIPWVLTTPDKSR
jgi:hypothetical protein